LRHGSLFSGIGGFDLAAEWMQWENLFHCEWNEFGQKVLKYYWPNAISYEDITKTDFSIHRGDIDIISGGFPCQPYSTAGKRLGKEDDRHLWPEMLRAIREIQPRWVVGENVLGLVNWNGGLVFEEVQADLESEGYEVQPFILPAAGVNAPHRRDRVWFVAYAKHNGHITTKGGRSDGETGTRSEEGEDGSEQFKGICQPKELGGLRDATNTKIESCRRELQQRPGQGKPRGQDCRNVTNANSGRQPSQEHGQEKARRIAKKSLPNDWKNFPTQSPICGGDDGVSTELDGITFPKWRNESIKAFGNAIVPQVALQIFKAIQAYEATRKEM
jgi:DNA (cytosine-5)-methyltransferase 1